MRKDKVDASSAGMQDSDDMIRTMLSRWFSNRLWLSELPEVRDFFHGLMKAYGDDFRLVRKRMVGFPELDDLCIIREVKKVREDRTAVSLCGEQWVIGELCERAERAIRHRTRVLSHEITIRNLTVFRTKAAQFIRLASTARTS